MREDIMKVLITSDVFPPDIGGIQTFTYGLAKNLSYDERIEEVTVLTFGAEKIGKEKINEYLKVHRLPRSNLASQSFAFLHKLTNFEDYDILHSTTIFPAGFLTSLFSLINAEKDFFVTVFGLDVLSGLNFFKTRLPIKWTLDRSEKVLAFSNSTRDKIKKVYEEENKIITVYPGFSVPKSSNGFKDTRFEDRYLSSEDDFVVLFVGRLVERKGVDDLIRGIKELDGKEVKFLIVGDGPKRKGLETLAKKMGVKDQVHFVGKIKREKISKFYAFSDVFCMPSKFLQDKGDVEGLGLVFLEAQSYGLPVIGTESGGIPEAINDKKSGFVVPSGDPQTLAHKIRKLKENSNLYQDMSENAKQFVNKKFSWEKCVERHVRIYNDC
ncbi:hypothetical protein AKJ52_00785 [candidate division MSBL1 archaeon SCGC-AAA382C18]|uniref:Glycosyl transferase family 1 domain-containing protein n=1 Tax=candidate division MSBL1 archaeon SCGC-AAA382C18 TaxID=1698281 RepID=A0A133VL64_9EURY|nr:hypothetical protein AKJ52_00785 [candidate division MSBL1 archaeon SCGC-AAA382C18]